MKKTAIILLALALAALMLAGCTGGGDDLSGAVEIPPETTPAADGSGGDMQNDNAAQNGGSSGNTAEYGLDSPVLQIQLTLRDGASVTLLIGDYSEAGEGDYLSLSGSDTVYLVAASARTAITNNLNTCYMEASDAE